MRPGDMVGPFVIEKAIGSGAMGTVLRAKHTENGMRVAIKVVAANLAANKTAMERFKRETDILKQLRHPNIVRLVATGRHGGVPFYAMEFVDGESLDRVLARRQRITWEEVVDLGRQLCAALQHAHDRGIIHRDLKPSNLMVLPGGGMKLTDFGIAKDVDVTALTSTHCTVGTAAYMSPEQCRGQRDITTKSDLYSMGIMFYELLTGRKPFQADSPMEMFMLHINAGCQRPSRIIFDIPIWLDTLVMQLLEKVPEQRPLNADAVAEALARVREKVEAQQSVGMETVKARSADRTRLDEEDREAARTLLGKKKRKKRRAPFYRSPYLRMFLFAALLAAVGWVFYTVFLKVPDPESLYEQARPLMLSPDMEKWREAREGPVATYLHHYSARSDSQAKQMRDWADEVDGHDTEMAMYTRMATGGFGNDEAYQAAKAAFEEERTGKLKDAREKWQLLLKYKDDPENRGWFLVAESYKKDLDRVDAETAKLQARLRAEDPKNRVTGGSAGEDLAVKALRAEQHKKYAEARRSWEDLRQQMLVRYSRPQWYYLLAARKVREPLEESSDTKDGEKGP